MATTPTVTRAKKKYLAEDEDLTVVAEVPEKTVDEKINEQIENMMGQSRRAAQIACQEVKIFPHHAEVEINGIKKAISLTDFKNIIDSQLQIESKLVPTALPVNTLLIARSASEFQISCYYPERKLDLKLDERSYDNPRQTKLYKGVQMPNIVISHKLKMDNGFWLVVDTKYMATSKRPTELPEDRILFAPEGEGMWRVPLPNFYEHYGMCYGGNTMPMKHGNNLRGLDYFYQVLAESPFNFDLGINVRDMTIPQWFKHLTEVEKFPYDKLTSRPGY
jgi:hypothetical protein